MDGWTDGRMNGYTDILCIYESTVYVSIYMYYTCLWFYKSDLYIYKSIYITIFLSIHHKPIPSTCLRRAFDAALLIEGPGDVTTWRRDMWYQPGISMDSLDSLDIFGISMKVRYQPGWVMWDMLHHYPKHSLLETQIILSKDGSKFQVTIDLGLMPTFCSVAKGWTIVG